MHKISTPDEPAAAQIVFEDFAKVDIRAGVIVSAEPFPEARKPAYRLAIDFGPAIGVKKSSAQITEHYTLEELVGRSVMAVVNFPPRQIGPVRSEVLVLGFPDANGAIVLAAPMSAVPRGARLA
ncbi:MULTISPECIES: tRNA-binding protein [unclassified Phenylobacterium]|jgi:tRNA-binding protein|uniref:tRNA-binding protein n=1 Tax=unclassified Phenylobacterium TaxID=2640670 RepID=UPI0022B308BF|nr:tRNA-binding protein [Phenylobacterium sp. NIBR 498073]MBS0489504.1 tRNA-binding protein [Pseudomonadota bacterium]WGU38803.1 tRNA-binding protein [Phenylobacterium sp. NIBR 498073]